MCFGSSGSIISEGGGAGMPFSPRRVPQPPPPPSPDVFLEWGCLVGPLIMGGWVPQTSPTHSPSSHKRRLLQDNVLGDAGVRALAAFRDAPALRALELNAQNNRVGDDGVEGLAAIAAAPLRTLNLDLSSNAFADRGLTALAALGRTTSLTDLSLNLGCNMYLTDYCVDRLCTALFASNSLRDLYLGFGGTDLDLQVSNCNRSVRTVCHLWGLSRELQPVCTPWHCRNPYSALNLARSGPWHIMNWPI